MCPCENRIMPNCFIHFANASLFTPCSSSRMWSAIVHATHAPEKSPWSRSTDGLCDGQCTCWPRSVPCLWLTALSMIENGMSQWSTTSRWDKPTAVPTPPLERHQHTEEYQTDRFDHLLNSASHAWSGTSQLFCQPADNGLEDSARPSGMSRQKATKRKNYQNPQKKRLKDW